MSKIAVLLNEAPRPWHVTLINGLRTTYGASHVRVRNGQGWTQAAFVPTVKNLLAWGPDIFVTADAPSTRAVAATSQIPIVSAHASEPGGATAGANVTGIAIDLIAVAPLRVAILDDLLSGAHLPVGLVWNNTNPVKGDEADAVEAAATVPSTCRRPVANASGIPAAIAGARSDDARSLIVLGDPVTVANASAIVALAENGAHPLPTLYASSDAPEAGGLASYGVNRDDVWAKVAGYVHWICAGLPAPDITDAALELVVNEAVAATFGIAPVPANLAGIQVRLI